MTENNPENQQSGAEYPEKERRRSPRVRSSRIILLVAKDGVADGSTIDISLEGFGGVVNAELEVGEIVHVYIQGDDQQGSGRLARVVRKIDGSGVGFEFLPEDAEDI